MSVHPIGEGRRAEPISDWSSGLGSLWPSSEHVSLYVLVVDDSESDSRLLARHLGRNGFDVYAERVESQAQMNEALARRRWDLVLCDYNMPGFDARGALMALRTVDRDAPFIVVSGVIPDDQALALMREGACDYVMKSNLARLPLAIRRELGAVLKERALRRAETDLAVAQQWHAAALASSLDGYATLDGLGRVLEFNASFSELVGSPPQEIPRTPFEDYFEPHGVSAGAALDSARAKGYARFDCSVRRRSGEQAHVTVSITCHPTAQAEFFLFTHDVTDRRQREEALRVAAIESERARVALMQLREEQESSQRQVRESEQRLRGILEHSVSATLVLEGGTISYANPCAGELLGRSREQLSGCRLLDLVTEADRPPVAQALDRLNDESQSKVDLAFSAPRPDGQLAEIGAVFTRTWLAGQPVILCAAQDIGERRRAQEQIARHVAQLEASMQATLQAVSQMVELRDPYTAGHEKRVGDLAAAIGAAMGLDENTVKGLRLAGYVHDIGKISTPAELLSKPTRLTPTEYELVKQHCRAGYEVLAGVDFPWPIAQVILQHHERLDGSGYPLGLVGDQIALEARIVGVADVVEAMSSHRPYRAARGIDEALAEIERGAGTLYDAPAVVACLSLFRQKAFAFPA